AVMEDALFHPKVWLFESAEDVMAAHGSSNVPYAGLKKNIEQIAISRSWEDPNQRYITDKLGYQFGRLWENKEDRCIGVTLPRAIKDSRLKTYSYDAPPTEAALEALYKRAVGTSQLDEPPPAEYVPGPARAFAIPVGLRYEDGPFAHQGQAV